MPACCLALMVRHCGVQKIRPISKHFTRLAFGHFKTAYKNYLFNNRLEEVLILDSEAHVILITRVVA